MNKEKSVKRGRGRPASAETKLAAAVTEMRGFEAAGVVGAAEWLETNGYETARQVAKREADARAAKREALSKQLIQLENELLELADS